jgi:hypothetical protein
MTVRTSQGARQSIADVQSLSSPSQAGPSTQDGPRLLHTLQAVTLKASSRPTSPSEIRQQQQISSDRYDHGGFLFLIN